MGRKEIAQGFRSGPGRPKKDEKNSKPCYAKARLSLLEDQILEDVCDFEKKNKSEVIRAALLQYAKKYYKLDDDF